MRLFYDPLTGEIFYAVWFENLFKFSHTTNLALSIFDIDPIAENKAICIDLEIKIMGHKRNEAGEFKYYMQNNELYERENWIEVFDA